MSAYVVNDITINRIIGWLEINAYNSMYLLEGLKQFGDVYAENFWPDLAGAMHKLNIEAVDQRYSERTENPKPFVYAPLIISPIQTYVSLQCWIYQCSEGDVPKRPLYQFFDTNVSLVLAHKIVRALPEYEHTEWA